MGSVTSVWEIIPLWLALVAEGAVAWVIWYELEHSRRVNFLEKVTSSVRNAERRDIYDEYLDLSSDGTLHEKSEQFRDLIYRYPYLKEKCDAQISLINDLGISLDQLFSKKEPFVRIFPHAAIYLWIIFRTYIIQRRKDAGPWFAEPLLRFTVRCFDLVIKENQPLHLRGSTGNDGVRFTVEELKAMCAELKSIVPERYPWEFS